MRSCAITSTSSLRRHPRYACRAVPSANGRCTENNSAQLKHQRKQQLSIKSMKQIYKDHIHMQHSGTAVDIVRQKEVAIDHRQKIPALLNLKFAPQDLTCERTNTTTQPLHLCVTCNRRNSIANSASNHAVSIHVRHVRSHIVLLDSKCG